VASLPYYQERQTDDFMREGPDDTWRALSGEWQLAGTSFPERSANPFSLRARFRLAEPTDMFLERRWKRQRSGLGVHLSSWRGLINVERITGGGPAARAGVEEHDIVVAIDGQPYLSMDGGALYEDLIGPPGTPVALTLLRHGEDKVKNVVVRRQTYRWARADYGHPVPGSKTQAVPGEAIALAASGLSSWDDYRFEASVRPTRDGGAGIAFAVHSAHDYHAFASGAAGDPTRLALVRVRDGVPHVLADRPWSPRPQTYYRMAVDLTGHTVRAFVDGELALEAPRDDVPAGRIGLWASSPATDHHAGDVQQPVSGAYFDDVAVSADARDTAPQSDSRASPALATEVDMRGWANPADEWVLDYDSGWWWQRFRFPRAASLMVSRDARFATLRATLGARARDTASGVTFTVSRADGTCTVSYGGSDLARAEGLHGEQKLVLALDGATARVLVDDVERASCTLPSTPTGDALAVHGLENISARGVLTAASPNVLQYHFRRAPVDWAVESGGWGVINKWICDPRFSWFGGHGRSQAAIWNKRSVGGDVALDFYAALVMTSDDPPYERVGDFACTILAEDARLASGYTLIVSGGRNEWTRLYGEGKLLAETRDVAHRLPSNVNDTPGRRELHQRWFRITLERSAGRVRALLDGHEVLSCPDSIGRDDGHAALWTQDNGMLVSRARLAAERVGKDVRSLALWGARARRRSLHGLVNSAFGEITTAIAVDGTGPDNEPAVRVTNAVCGGMFAVASTDTALPSDVISFSFRAQKNTHVDLYLVADHNDPLSRGPLRVRLTGPATMRERHPILRAAPVHADGEWHRVEIDLYAMSGRYLALHGGGQRLPVRRMRPVFACLGEGEGEGDAYLPAGLGGNGLGAQYWVSGMSIEPRTNGDASPPRVKRILTAGEDGTPEGIVRVLFDDDRTGVDGNTVIVVLKSDRAPMETRTKTNLPPSMIDVGPPRFTPPVIPPGRTNHVLLRSGNPAFYFDSATQELEIDLAAAVGATSDGTGWTVEVREYADGARRRGKPVSRLIGGTGADTTPPVITSVSFEPSIPGELELDFEWGARTRRELAMRQMHMAPSMRIDTSTASKGNASLKLTAPYLASPMIFKISDHMTTPARIKELSFSYRMGPQMPINLFVRDHRGYRGVLFTDLDDPSSERSQGTEYLGRIDGVRTDMTWRRATVPMSRLFAEGAPLPMVGTARGIYLMDSGWMGLWPGDSYWIDDVCALGVRRGAMLAARWRAIDASGVTEAAWSLDGRATTRVDPNLANHVTMHDGAGRVMLQGASELRDGDAYLHLAVKDAQGNWSDTVHKRLLVDNTPPAVSHVAPADGETSTSRIFTVRFDDYAGLDPTSIALQLAVTHESDGVTTQQAFRVDGRACSYDPKTGTLTLIFRPPFVARPLRGRAKVAAKVLSARDTVGNMLRSPYAWSWTFDTAIDRTPPSTPRIRVTTCRPYRGYSDGPTFGNTNDFERELGPVEGYRGCTVTRSPDAACFGKGGARIAIDAERGGAFSFRLRERHWYINRRVFLTFMYRIPPDAVDSLDLELDLIRDTLRFPIHGARADEPLVADGRWHRAVINMGRHVDRSGFKFVHYLGMPLKIGSKAIVAGRGTPGVAFDIDDLEFVIGNWGGLALIVDHGADPSGVDALSVVWDQSPDTVPPASVTTPLPPYQSDVQRRLPIPQEMMNGRRFLHVRSRDGAGNWSETGHMALDFQGR
jgi:hypothetical protein